MGKLEREGILETCILASWRVTSDDSIFHSSHVAGTVTASTQQCYAVPYSYPWVGKIPWRRKWQPTPVFLPGEPHGQRSLEATVHGVAKSRTRLKRIHFTSHLQLPSHSNRPRLIWLSYFPFERNRQNLLLWSIEPAFTPDLWISSNKPNQSVIWARVRIKAEKSQNFKILMVIWVLYGYTSIASTASTVIF